MKKVLLHLSLFIALVILSFVLLRQGSSRAFDLGILTAALSAAYVRTFYRIVRSGFAKLYNKFNPTRNTEDA